MWFIQECQQGTPLSIFIFKEKNNGFLQKYFFLTNMCVHVRVINVPLMKKQNTKHMNKSFLKIHGILIVFSN